QYLATELKRLEQAYPLLQAVRGDGLLQILELDVAGLPQFVQQSFGYLFWGHMLRDPKGGAAVVVCPLHNTCLRLAPPLNIIRSDVDQLIATLERSLAKGAAQIIEDCAAYCKSRGDDRTSEFFSKRAEEVWTMDTLNAKPFECSTFDTDVTHSGSSLSRSPANAAQHSFASGGAKPRVCVIGSGVGGISTIKSLKDKGIPFDCFEARDQIGGIWAYDETKKNTSTWKHLNMNTPKGYYQYEDAPMPEDYPDYPTRQQVQDYLLSYLDKHDLRDRIQLNTPVKHAARRSDGTWNITLADGRVQQYDALVVANGHHNTPALPEYATRDTFDGDAIHSMEYRARHDYKDKRVMIVGVGNSGAQIAVDVSHDATMTYLSLRRGVYILPHYLLGMRVDKAMGPLNAWWVKKMMPYPLHGMMMTAIYNLVVAKHSQMGMPKPDHWMLSCLPTMSENLGNRIGDGKVKIVGEIDHIDGKVVTFKDGSELEMDAIIYSTGFKTDFPFFDENFLTIEDNKIPFYKRIFHPEVPNLAFVGCFQAIDWGFLPIMEKQSKIVASYFAGEYALPTTANQKKDIAREQKLIAHEFLSSLR
ncbi:MAG: NAD(P)-binding domain-containing protein, partial [Pseudomonadota bacterium]